MKNKASTTLLWILTIFMILSAWVYFPSVASIIMLLFSAIAIPLEPVRNFWKAKKLQGITKGILLGVLFFVAVGIAPTDKAETDSKQSNEQNPQTVEDETEPDESEDPAPEEGADGAIKSGSYTLPCGMELQFYDSVRNDVTGNWRRSATSSSLVPADYAFEYYTEMFSSDDEIHAIWNATLKTTTSISVVFNLLYVDTREYVDGEEHDAKIMFSGELLDSRIIDIETGELVNDDPASIEDLTVDSPQKPEPEPKPPKGTDLDSTSVSDETAPPAEEPSGQEPVKVEPEQEQTEAPEEVPAEEPKTTNYVLNSGTMKFHKPTCSSVGDISASNRVDFSGTRDEVVAMGYVACKRCYP